MLAPVDYLFYFSGWDLPGFWHDEWFSTEAWTFGISCYETLDLIWILCVSRRLLPLLQWVKGDVTWLLLGGNPGASLGLLWHPGLGMCSLLLLSRDGSSASCQVSTHITLSRRDTLLLPGGGESPDSAHGLHWYHVESEGSLLPSGDENPCFPLNLLWLNPGGGVGSTML